jgi:hypothetical protein
MSASLPARVVRFERNTDQQNRVRKLSSAEPRLRRAAQDECGADNQIFAESIIDTQFIFKGYVTRMKGRPMMDQFDHAAKLTKVGAQKTPEKKTCVGRQSST